MHSWLFATNQWALGPLIHSRGSGYACTRRFFRSGPATRDECARTREGMRDPPHTHAHTPPPHHPGVVFSFQFSVNVHWEDRLGFGEFEMPGLHTGRGEVERASVVNFLSLLHRLGVHAFRFGAARNAQQSAALGTRDSRHVHLEPLIHRRRSMTCAMLD